MATEVILPKVDMDMATGTIGKWLVEDGAQVKKGQVIFEIETDKSAMEIDAPADGVIKLSNAKAGDVLPIGALVAMIFGAGENPTPFAQTATPQTSAFTPPAAATNVGAPANTDSRLPQNDAERLGTRATPLARRLAREKNIDLATLKGSGPHGRIVADDVANAKTVLSTKPIATASMQSEVIRAMYQPGSFVVKPLDGMRRIIAERLTQSKQTVPHFYLSATCTIDNLLAIRERLNLQGAKQGFKLSINDFIIKAYALALQQVPDANVTFTDEGILYHKASDVGVAVSVEGGLFTPIVRNADAKSLSSISAEVKDLAARAKARKLQANDYQGGSAAISNLGMFGVESFTAIINPPQATILAVGKGVERFIPINKQPVLATQMQVTLSCDHRAVDGATGAKLLQSFQQLIEEPALMLV